MSVQFGSVLCTNACLRYSLLTTSRSPVVPFYPFLGEGSPTKIDYRKKGALILTSLLEDLDVFVRHLFGTVCHVPAGKPQV